jgi:hypothetical protein
MNDDPNPYFIAFALVIGVMLIIAFVSLNNQKERCKELGALYLEGKCIKYTEVNN